MAKKVTQLILSLCAAYLFGMTVQAAEGYTEFYVENQGGKKGEVVTIPVQFNSGQEVGGFQLSIYYDSDVMEFQSLEKGNLIEENKNGIFDYNHIEESSEIVVVYVVSDTVKDEGVIVDLKFKLKKDCQEQLPIGMEADQVVDNTDESAPLDGKVSGVDAEFQKQIAGKASKNPDDTKENDALKEENEGEEKGAAETNQSEEAVKTPEETHTDSGRQKDSEGVIGVVGIAIMVVVAGTAAGGFFYHRKKKK